MAMDEKGAESAEMYRWQGRVDSQLTEHNRRLDTINGDAARARIASEEIIVQLAVIKTKVALWSTIGSLLGASLVTTIVQLVVRLPG